MIWSSTGTMVAIELLIVTLVVIAAVRFWRQQRPLGDQRVRRGAILILSGFAVVALFYSIDLFAMLVLPSLRPMPEAMAPDAAARLAPLIETWRSAMNIRLVTMTSGTE